ncbi:hypothetical protein [Metabacillus sp. RGM 3146]|uniref:hypothetical protein n=1 Tax=Metabacillus sp. RGM 3146 TaxID=3401092 RepID=UPI003B9ABFFE
MGLSTLFLSIFIGTLVVLFANILLGNVLDILFHISSGLFNMTSTFCLIGLTSLIGYVLSINTNLPTFIMITIGVLVALGVTAVLNIFVFLPLSRLESTTSFHIKDLEGTIGRVTLTIAKDTVGEVTVKTPLGVVPRTARSLDNEEIVQGETVLVIDVKDNVFYVKKYKPMFDNELTKQEDF